VTGKDVSSKDTSAAPEEETVADYLATNPDFFLRHPGLLEALEVPHDSGDAASLIEYQVRTLREQNAQLRRKLQGLVSVARQKLIHIRPPSPHRV